MKPILGWIFIVLCLLAVMYLLYAYIKANYFEDGAFATTPAFKADAVMRLEAVGEDPRIYVFTPPKVPNKRCVFFAAQGKGGLECFDKQ